MPAEVRGGSAATLRGLANVIVYTARLGGFYLQSTMCSFVSLGIRSQWFL